jgi:hypothetical protein
MSLRTIGTSLMLAVISCLWCQPGLAIGIPPKSSDEAKQDLTLPQNFRVSELRQIPDTFKVSLVYEWDQAMSATKYTLNKACAYKFSAPDREVTRPSGLTVMEGPGPKYRVEAVCNCLPPAQVYIEPSVSVYGAKTLVYMAKPPVTTAPNDPKRIVACTRPK